MFPSLFSTTRSRKLILPLQFLNCEGGGGFIGWLFGVGGGRLVVAFYLVVKGWRGGGWLENGAVGDGGEARCCCRFGEREGGEAGMQFGGGSGGAGAWVGEEGWPTVNFEGGGGWGRRAELGFVKMSLAL